MIYCVDADLLYWEPKVFADCAAVAQVLAAGSGAIAGSAVTVAAVDLPAAGVQAGGIAALTGAVAGTFPIVSVDSPTQMTVSLLADALDPGTGAPPAAQTTGATGAIGFTVRTFWAQRRVVTDLLHAAIGIRVLPGSGPTPTVLNPGALKRAAAIGTLQMVYNAMAALNLAAGTETPYVIRSNAYAKLFRQTVRGLKIEVDTDGDGAPDVVRRPGVIECVRQ